MPPRSEEPWEAPSREGGLSSWKGIPFWTSNMRAILASTTSAMSNSKRPPATSAASASAPETTTAGPSARSLSITRQASKRRKGNGSNWTFLRLECSATTPAPSLHTCQREPAERKRGRPCPRIVASPDTSQLPLARYSTWPLRSRRGPHVSMPKSSIKCSNSPAASSPCAFASASASASKLAASALLAASAALASPPPGPSRRSRSTARKAPPT
mmetsp:Transcript_16510/g.57815  ORF Transcript_16510/g.57815 Transcript_16510/m.57815 type:complete len:215 (+) Transcript_16510:1305-1949(+)